jgi:hypothetical protein
MSNSTTDADDEKDEQRRRMLAGQRRAFELLVKRTEPSADEEVRRRAASILMTRHPLSRSGRCALPLDVSVRSAVELARAWIAERARAAAEAGGAR